MGALVESRRPFGEENFSDSGRVVRVTREWEEPLVGRQFVMIEYLSTRVSLRLNCLYGFLNKAERVHTQILMRGKRENGETRTTRRVNTHIE